MKEHKMAKAVAFSSKVFRLGINPCVNVPASVLRELFGQSRRQKGPISVAVRLNGKRFSQTVVRYQGAWRLYINTYMRQASEVDVGDMAHVEVAFDPRPRTVPMNKVLAAALSKKRKAKAVFERLSPSRQKEILRYLNSLKIAKSAARNVQRVIRQMLGGRPKHYKFQNP